jgi:hypothetical protein
MALRRAWSGYVRDQGRRRTRRRSRTTDLPFWLLAPAWYAHEPAERRVLPDLLFAQYCLLLTIRIHDDLLDEQAQGSWLILVGDNLLVEAQAVLARSVDRSGFWSIFRAAMRKTLHGIAEVDRLQCGRYGMPASARRLYADVGSVFSVGVAAVCARTNRLADYSRFQRFASDLAIAGQLLDDLADLEEDAARGRLTVAATTLMGSRRLIVRCREQAFRRRFLARRVLVDGGADAVIDLARAHLQAAARTAARMDPPQAAEYARRMLVECDALGNAAHRARVDALFGPVTRLT